MAHFLSQNWLLNRRHVLRGLGVSLALPLLDCMRPLGAAESKSRPKRSVFIYLPNGVNTIDFQITQAVRITNFRNRCCRWRNIGRTSRRLADCIIRMAWGIITIAAPSG